MKAVGLTGGIGMGKTTAARLLAESNVPVVDTDEIARQIVEPGQPALAMIQDCFGPALVGTDGRLRRQELAKIVFADAPARQRLEAILHPRIREIWMARVESWREENRASVGVVVIPLLFETNAAGHFHATICVACSAATQLLRLRARGWTEEQISQRVHAQWPVEKKMLFADHLVWTEGAISVHLEQLKRILEVTSAL